MLCTQVCSASTGLAGASRRAPAQWVLVLRLHEARSATSCRRSAMTIAEAEAHLQAAEAGHTGSLSEEFC